MGDVMVQAGGLVVALSRHISCRNDRHDLPDCLSTTTLYKGMAIVVEGDQSPVEPSNLAKASEAALGASPANSAVRDRNGSSEPIPETIKDLSAYALEPLRRDAELVLYRGRSDADPRHIFVLAPAAEQPSHGTLGRIEHEYALRAELDPVWAVRPLALVRDRGRTVLVLEAPSGEHLDRILERPLELTQFLRVAIALAAAMSKLHERGIIHKDIKPPNVVVASGSGQVWLTGFGIATDQS